MNSPGVSSAEATNRQSAVVSRIIGSTPDPIREHNASTTIRSPLRPRNRKKSSSLPAHSPSTTTGFGIGLCGGERVVRLDLRHLRAPGRRRTSTGFDTPSSVTTRIG